MTMDDFNNALKNIELLNGINLTIVPLDPSPYMMQIAAMKGKVSKETALIVYKAMIGASLLSPLGDEKTMH